MTIWFLEISEEGRMKAVEMVNAVQAQIVDIATLMEQERFKEAQHQLKKLDGLMDAYRDMLQKFSNK